MKENKKGRTNKSDFPNLSYMLGLKMKISSLTLDPGLNVLNDSKQGHFPCHCHQMLAHGGKFSFCYLMIIN